MTGLLLQACAPKQDGAGSESNWRLSPVDISDGDPGTDPEPQPILESVDPKAVTVPVYRFKYKIVGGIYRNSIKTSFLQWLNEGKEYEVFKFSTDSRYPLYSCLKENDFFTSASDECEGNEVIGTIGFVEGSPTDLASRPLYRCTGPVGYHVDTSDTQRCLDIGYRVEGIFGYVP